MYSRYLISHALVAWQGWVSRLQLQTGHNISVCVIVSVIRLTGNRLTSAFVVCYLRWLTGVPFIPPV